MTACDPAHQFYANQPSSRKMRMTFRTDYGVFDVTNIVPELASEGDQEFQEWRDRAEDYIKAAYHDGKSDEQIQSGLAKIAYHG